MKKQFFIRLIITIILLCGCQSETTSYSDDIQEKSTAESGESKITTYPDDKEYIEKGISVAKNIAAQEDGHGIMLFEASSSLENYDLNNSIVLTTDDNGKTWEVNEKLLLYDYEGKYSHVSYCFR